VRAATAATASRRGNGRGWRKEMWRDREGGYRSGEQGTDGRMHERNLIFLFRFFPRQRSLEVYVCRVGGTVTQEKRTHQWREALSAVAMSRTLGIITKSGSNKARLEMTASDDKLFVRDECSKVYCLRVVVAVDNRLASC
jgi:hypothetical protein